ncbi:MAG: hypothetical protein WBO73_14365 [Gammaproteobacteria bacterium]
MTDTFSKFILTTVLLISATAVGCSTSKTTDDLIPCTEPRPEVCTMDYNPVCATRQLSGIERWKTYSNACTACSDVTVIGYRKGACNAVKK